MSRMEVTAKRYRFDPRDPAAGEAGDLQGEGGAGDPMDIGSRDAGTAQSVDHDPSGEVDIDEAAGVLSAMDEAELDEVDAYDGIWACASLLHVRPEELPDVLASAARALEEKGVLYCSFKFGDFRGYRGGRWFTDLEEGTLSVLLEPCFDVVRMWASPDVRPGRGEEPWLNCLATRR